LATAKARDGDETERAAFTAIITPFSPNCTEYAAKRGISFNKNAHQSTSLHFATRQNQLCTMALGALSERVHDFWLS
jgi:hypothetical protein